MRIGELAEQAGISTKAIRYYAEARRLVDRLEAAPPATPLP